MSAKPLKRPDVSPPRRGSLTATGLWTPITSSWSAEHVGSRYARTFLTYTELGGDPVDEPWIISRLQKMSAYDCLQALGRLSCMVQSAPIADANQQLRIMQRLGWPQVVRDSVEPILRSDGGRALFFPQQLVHLSRLAVLHADPRPMDNFEDHALVDDFIQCVLGVTELLAEDGVDLDIEANQVSWILRQTTINERSDSVAMWARYYDIFVRTWDQVATPEAFDAAATFEEFAGIGIPRWLAAGFAFYGLFLRYGNLQSEDFFVVPDTAFSDTSLQPSEWNAFLRLSAVTLDKCRDRILEEQKRFGPTVYRCQSFEERPLLRVLGGAERIFPLALDSLERHITEGIFWILSDAAMDKGLAREHFSGAFGQVFEEWVQRTFERVIPAIGVSRVHRAKPYAGPGGYVDSTDVIIDYEPEAIFVEIVAKRPQAATLTRGDCVAFEQDLQAGVLKKAKQLDRNLADFRSGQLVLGDMNPSRITWIFPVILSIEGFPSMPPIPKVVTGRIEAEGLLQNLPSVALLSAEELAAIEAFMEQGVTFLDLLRGWKIDSGLAGFPFSNYVDMTPSLMAKASHRSRYQEECWSSIVGVIRGLFTSEDSLRQPPLNRPNR
jgi:hypothetical protein